jgi:hypothetical protein
MNSCDIIEIDGDTAHPETVKKFVKIANTQKHTFKDVYPWHIALNKSVLMFAAFTNLKNLRKTKIPSGSTELCGWLTAFIDKDKKSAYIAELSSRSVTDKDPRFKGVAYKLYIRLINYCKNNDLKYIYLVPLNSIVESIYIKWGLKKLDYQNTNSKNNKKTMHMFYLLNVDDIPDNNTLADLSKPFTYEEMNTIAEHLSNTQIDMIENIKTSDKNLYSDIIDNLSLIISLCDESNNVDKEVGKCLQKYFPR